MAKVRGVEDPLPQPDRRMIRAEGHKPGQVNGFPPGTPSGRPEAFSVHGTLRIVAPAIGFLCFVAACFVLARRFASQRQAGWTWFTRITGIAFLGAFVGLASGSSSAIIVLGLGRPAPGLGVDGRFGRQVVPPPSFGGGSGGSVLAKTVTVTESTSSRASQRAWPHNVIGEW